jgi:hypothetical protein
LGEVGAFAFLIPEFSGGRCPPIYFAVFELETAGDARL